MNLTQKIVVGVIFSFALSLFAGGVTLLIELAEFRSKTSEAHCLSQQALQNQLEDEQGQVLDVSDLFTCQGTWQENGDLLGQILGREEGYIVFSDENPFTIFVGSEVYSSEMKVFTISFQDRPNEYVVNYSFSTRQLAEAITEIRLINCGTKVSDVPPGTLVVMPCEVK